MRIFPLMLAVLLAAPLIGCDREGTPPSHNDNAKTHAPKEGAARLAPLAEDAPLRRDTTPDETKKFSASGNYLAGKYAYNRRDTAGALGFMEQTLAVDDTNRGLTQQSFFLRLSQGDMPQALTLARKVRSVSEDDFFANLVLAMDAFSRQQWRATGDAVEAMADSEFRQLIDPLLQAWLAAAEGKPDRAVSALQRASASPALGNLWQIHQALLRYQAGDIPGAIRLFDETRKDVSNLPLRYAVLYAQLLREQKSSALQVFTSDYLERNDNDELARSLLERVASGNDAYIGMPKTPAQGMAQALFDVAGILNRSQSRPISIFFARLALFLDPAFRFDQLFLGNIFEAEGRLPDALHVYNAIPKDSPFWWVAQLRIAAVQDSQKDTKGAIATLSQVLQAQPDRLSASIELGDLLRREERFAEAVSVYSDALQKLGEPTPSHWSLYYARGICEERTGQWAAAEADLKKALELKPDQPYVLNYLAYSWIEQGIKLPEAEEMLTRALNQVPDDPYVMDSMAWAKFHQGQTEEAVRLLEEAIEIKPQDPTINEHLGDAYWQVGRRNEAVFQWNRALSFDPEAKDIPEIQRKLREGYFKAP